jgi:hypothetical protein
LLFPSLYREEQKQNNHPRASKIVNHAIDLASGHVFAGTPGRVRALA